MTAMAMMTSCEGSIAHPTVVAPRRVCLAAGVVQLGAKRRDVAVYMALMEPAEAHVCISPRPLRGRIIICTLTCNKCSSCLRTRQRFIRLFTPSFPVLPTCFPPAVTLVLLSLSIYLPTQACSVTLELVCQFLRSQWSVVFRVTVLAKDSRPVRRQRPSALTSQASVLGGTRNNCTAACTTLSVCSAE